MDALYLQTATYLLRPGEGEGGEDRNGVEKLQDRRRRPGPGLPVPSSPATSSSNHSISFLSREPMDKHFLYKCLPTVKKGESWGSFHKTKYWKSKSYMRKFHRENKVIVMLWIKKPSVGETNQNAYQIQQLAQEASARERKVAKSHFQFAKWLLLLLLLLWWLQCSTKDNANGVSTSPSSEKPEHRGWQSGLNVNHLQAKAWVSVQDLKQDIAFCSLHRDSERRHTYFS